MRLLRQDLSFKDYMILQVLQQNHSFTPNKIGRHVGLSAETVRSRIYKMKQGGVLRANREIEVPLLGKRMQTELEAVYIPQHLGLLRQHVLFHNVPNARSLNALLSFCEAHPYTHYRAVAYGNGTTLYAQFDIPPKIMDEMEHLYQVLEEAQLFDYFQILKTDFVGKSEVDLAKWDYRNKEWLLGDGNAFPRTLSIIDLWEKFLMEGKVSPIEKVRPAMHSKMDPLDMLLLREITVNAKASVKFLSQIYNKDMGTISRRLKALRENVALGSILYYDPSLFDIEYYQLIIGEFSPGSDLSAESLLSFLKSGDLPFESTVAIDGKWFMWYISSPASLASSFTDFIWQNVASFQVFQLNLSKARTYYFYHENYKGNKEWRTDTEWIFNDPLDAIGLLAKA